MVKISKNFKKFVFIKFGVLLMIVNKNPSVMIVNDDPLLTILNIIVNTILSK